MAHSLPVPLFLATPKIRIKQPSIPLASAPRQNRTSLAAAPRGGFPVRIGQTLGYPIPYWKDQAIGVTHFPFSFRAKGITRTMKKCWVKIHPGLNMTCCPVQGAFCICIVNACYVVLECNISRKTQLKQANLKNGKGLWEEFWLAWTLWL